VACGMPGVALTSIERLTGVTPALPDVARRLVPHFAAVFERELVEVPVLPPELISAAAPRDEPHPALAEQA